MIEIERSPADGSHRMPQRWQVDHGVSLRPRPLRWTIRSDLALSLKARRAPPGEGRVVQAPGIVLADAAPVMG
jgi:hypothetical protein